MKGWDQDQVRTVPRISAELWPLPLPAGPLFPASVVRMSSRGSSGLLSLPFEVLVGILVHLSPEDLGSIRLVCKALNDILERDLSWKVRVSGRCPSEGMLNCQSAGSILQLLQSCLRRTHLCEANQHSQLAKRVLQTCQAVAVRAATVA